MQKRIDRLKRLARDCIRDDAMDSPKSARSLMPAMAIADRLTAADQRTFWDALKKSIRKGAFDPLPDEKAPLRVFNDSPPLRLTSDLLIELTADDGIDGLGRDKPIFDEAYLKKTWARIDTWSRWCRPRFKIPASWDRVIEAQDQPSNDEKERQGDQRDDSSDKAKEPRKVTLVREAIERLGPREADEPVKAYQARISADIVETVNETVSPRHLAEAERLIRPSQGSKKAKKAKRHCRRLPQKEGRQTIISVVHSRTPTHTVAREDDDIR